MKLTLLFREYCSLCHQMRDELRPFQAAYGFELDIIDIDDFPDWEARYNELVPVLLHEGQEICHWHLDKQALEKHLQAHV